MIEASPIVELRERLASAIASGDERRFADFLRGDHLPAVGGHQKPSDLIFRALTQPPPQPQLLAGSAALLGRVLGRLAGEGDAVAEPESEPDLDLLLNNALALATELPADANLFQAIRHCAWLNQRGGFADVDSDEIETAFQNALLWQQTDDSLEEDWLQAIATSRPEDGIWTPDQAEALLRAWHGLLLIPPSPIERANGQVISPLRIDRGLQAIADAVAGTAESIQLLDDALVILQNTFPRSPEFWHRTFAYFAADWPPELHQAASERWPDLPQPEGLPPVPAQNQAPYATLKSEQERTLAEIWQEVLGIEQVSLDEGFRPRRSSARTAK